MIIISTKTLKSNEAQTTARCSDKCFAMFSRDIMKRRVFSRTLCASACYLNFIRSPKSSNPHTLVPPPPFSHSPRINSEEVHAHWCLGCSSDTVSWEGGGLCVCDGSSPLATREREIFGLAGTNLTQAHVGSANQRGRRGNVLHFYTRDLMESVILSLSHFLQKNTLPWNKWAVILCHRVCLSMKSLRNAIITFARQTFLWNVSE